MYANSGASRYRIVSSAAKVVGQGRHRVDNPKRTVLFDGARTYRGVQLVDNVRDGNGGMKAHVPGSCTRRKRQGVEVFASTRRDVETIAKDRVDSEIDDVQKDMLTSSSLFVSRRFQYVADVEYAHVRMRCLLSCLIGSRKHDASRSDALYRVVIADVVRLRDPFRSSVLLDDAMQ